MTTRMTMTIGFPSHASNQIVTPKQWFVFWPSYLWFFHVFSEKVATQKLLSIFLQDFTRQPRWRLFSPKKTLAINNTQKRKISKGKIFFRGKTPVIVLVLKSPYKTSIFSLFLWHHIELLILSLLLCSTGFINTLNRVCCFVLIIQNYG